MNAATTDPVQDDYDSPWKEAIEHHFPEFMVFLFADIDDLIDWSKGFSFDCSHAPLAVVEDIGSLR